MPRKAGRPPGSQNKVGKEQKEFIKGLLSETQEEFRNAFIFYAKESDKNPVLRSKFVDLSIELSKMVVPKPVEVEAAGDFSDFKALLEFAHKYNDED